MPVAVHRDLVPRRRDLGGERREPLDLLADEEERRRHAEAREQLEHGRRPLRMRPVVERERDAGDAVDPRANAEDTPRARRDRSRRGQPVRARRADQGADAQRDGVTVTESQ